MSDDRFRKSIEAADQIAAAVLYEGYILYPYRPSLKNRQRWTFGGLYPRPYSEISGGADRWTIQTECLLAGRPETTVEVAVRFLHLIQRTAGQFDTPLDEWPETGEPPFTPVEELRVGDRRFPSWQEAEERSVSTGPLELGELADRTHSVSIGFPGTREIELVRDGGSIMGVLIREQQPVQAAAEVRATSLGDGMYKLTVGIHNTWKPNDDRDLSRDEALMRSVVSTHAVLGPTDGEFVSLTDPPPEFDEAADACENVGLWPVLVGEAGTREMMLASPIILYDYPEIAPESAGDFFDATEIDEMLTLRVMTLTDDEKQQAAAVDDRIAELMQRTESMARSQMQNLHGTFRPSGPTETGDPAERGD